MESFPTTHMSKRMALDTTILIRKVKSSESGQPNFTSMSGDIGLSQVHNPMWRLQKMTSDKYFLLANGAQFQTY